MKKLEISILRDENGSLFAYNGVRLLFQFEERGLDDGLGRGQWFFWPHGNFRPVKFKGAFPMTYFLNLCKAYVFVVSNGEDAEMANEVEIVAGAEYLK